MKVDGISAALGGLREATNRLDRAAATIATDPFGDSCSSGESCGMTESIIGMLSARGAFVASLVAINASYSLIDETLRFGGYGE
jgi:hypothetical protein